MPRSTMVPLSTAKMTSALRIVESRWAMAIVVRRRMRVLECLLNDAFGFRVQRRGGLVEDQDRRVFKDHAGDRQPLALAAGEP